MLNAMFYFTLMLGICVMMTGKTWFSIWLGLEINLLSFLPIILLSANNTMEGGLKYFLIQAIASLILLQTSFTWFLLPSPELFILTPISLKLGMAPLHFWLPDIVKNLNWVLNLVLLTAQKIGPMYLLSTVGATYKLFLATVGALSVVVGAIGGLNEMDMRKLMAFSSISHMGWMAIGAMLTTSLWALYLLTYIFISSALMTAFYKMNVNYMSQLTLKNKDGMFIMVLFLSLGGFPPLLGFAPKWAILMKTSDLSLSLTAVLILTSVLTLFYYIRASLAATSLSSSNPSMTVPPHTSSLSVLTCTNILGGGLYMLMWSSSML
uniref:NADH-ubiquinone oxidoreductase chain 2 n=1 Tax=Proasellus cavaticus TaxID=1281949 RepID=A0A485M8W8_9CRUS|nr:NADH dehydrogenase subunit 2 [Proasellus cavaticus]